MSTNTSSGTTISATSLVITKTKQKPLSEMPVVTVEQLVRFRDAALAVEKERDELRTLIRGLVGALNIARRTLSGCANNKYFDEEDAINAIDSAIAKARGIGHE